MEAAAGPPGVVELTGPNFPVACCFSYQQVVLLKLVVCWFLCQRRLCLRGDLLGFAPLRAGAFFCFLLSFFVFLDVYYGGCANSPFYFHSCKK